MNASRTALVETAVGLAAGGPTAAIDTAKETGQELALSTLTGWITNTMTVKPDDAPHDLLASIKGVEDADVKQEGTWTGAMNHAAADMVADGFPQPTLVPVSFGLEHQKERTYTGDPYGQVGKNSVKPPPPVYIHGHGAPDDFVQAIARNNGEVDVQKMTPAQRDAYTRWLHDPAVVAKMSKDGLWTQAIGQNARS
ncbi:hypothetical protein [Streptomyces sp. NPDC021224]|uniref:hypothetical protein n=1 Tax=unclassified Streptomyces TaxID=2593676 RepID=UPI0037A45B50